MIFVYSAKYCVIPMTQNWCPWGHGNTANVIKTCDKETKQKKLLIPRSQAVERVVM